NKKARFAQVIDREQQTTAVRGIAEFGQPIPAIVRIAARHNMNTVGPKLLCQIGEQTWILRVKNASVAGANEAAHFPNVQPPVAINGNALNLLQRTLVAASLRDDCHGETFSG